MLDSILNGYPVYIYSFMKSGFNVKIISIKNLYINVFFLIAEYLTFIKAFVTKNKWLLSIQTFKYITCYVLKKTR